MKNKWPLKFSPFFLIQILLGGSAIGEPLSAGLFTFGGFVDTYAAHDFNDPDVFDRPYTTQVLHEDQLDINLAMLETKLNSENVRGRVAMQHGTSVESNYAAEEHIFWRYVQDASVGTKLSDKLWIDGGIYPAHVGFEGFNSRDNWNYTRSLVAEYSPYYETGVKLSYQFDDDTTGQFHVVNGWQNISSDADPFFGVQLSHALSKSTQLTYANLIGELDGQRVFNDFIAKTDLAENWSVAFQFDVGSQEREDEGDTAWWHGWALLTQYKFHPKVALGGRVERFHDPHQVVLSTVNGASFNAVGISVNLDVELYKGLFWRNEYKTFLGQKALFPENDEFSSTDQLVVTSLGFSF